MALQVRQGNDFELRQHGMPEEGVQGHDQRQPGITLVEEDQRKRQQRTGGAAPNDQQTPAGVITQPAPDIRRHAQIFGATQRISIGIATSSPIRAGANPRWWKYSARYGAVAPQ